MTVKLQMLFDVDMPTSIETSLDEILAGEPGLRQEYRVNGKTLSKMAPPLFHWLVRNGYMDCDLIVTVGEKKDAQVEDPVEQPTVLRGDVGLSLETNDDTA